MQQGPYKRSLKTLGERLHGGASGCKPPASASRFNSYLAHYVTGGYCVCSEIGITSAF
jgi:hypothetical protein